MKRLSVVAALALAAMALLASSAMAEVKWSHSSATWSGTLTFKRNGGNARTCTFSTHGIKTFGSGFGPATFWSWAVPCSSPSSTLEWAPEGWAEGKPGAYSLQFWDRNAEFGEWRSSPWSDRKWLGSGAEPFAVVPFTNGTVTTPSKITFNNTYLGETNFFEPVTATGTLSVLNGKTNVTLSGEG